MKIRDVPKNKLTLIKLKMFNSDYAWIICTDYFVSLHFTEVYPEYRQTSWKREISAVQKMSAKWPYSNFDNVDIELVSDAELTLLLL